MRIDFGASYKDISGLLKAPAHHAVKDESVSFEQDLKGVLIKPTKTTETIGDLQNPPQFAAIRPSAINSQSAGQRYRTASPHAEQALCRQMVNPD